MKNLLYYYSSTGNSLFDAISVGKRFGNAKLISMRHAQNRGIYVPDCETLGFVFPVHHWDMPLTVKSFIKQLEIHQVGYLYAIITCSFLDMSCINELENMLEEKGHKLDYTALHKNVYSNITSILSAAYNIEQNVKAEEELQKYMEHIYERKKGKAGNAFVFKTFHTTKLPELVRKVERRRFVFEVNNRCNQCGICISVCARGNIYLDNGKLKHKDSCEQCLSCIQYCPKGAINIKNITEEKERYHHPFISSSRIAKSQIIIENGSVIDKS